MVCKYLPKKLFNLLFGNREKFGRYAIIGDPDFKRWQEYYTQFYTHTQKNSIGRYVNHLGFQISRKIDLTNKDVLEVGPGYIEHLVYNHTRPKQYILADVRPDFLDYSSRYLEDFNVTNVVKLAVTGTTLPLKANSVDVIFTFHQLEHIFNLEDYLRELKRLLRPGGLIVGAVPCEGGLVWGLGRLLFSRSYATKALKINYDKIICWEHPNFVDTVKNILDKEFFQVESFRKPFSFLPYDLNFSWSFIYRNDKS